MTDRIIAQRDYKSSLTIRHATNAKRISLRIDATIRQGVLVLPPNISEQEGLEFAKKNKKWLEEQIARLPPLVPFHDGVSIPFRGKQLTVRHGGATRGLVEFERDQLLVFGRPEHFQRRLTDWLKDRARCEIARLVADKSSKIGCKAGRISIRDQKGRWGSCASSGNLAFSWRLIMAPDFVLDYVVAHEVAHLAEHNHSRAFWNIVRSLTNYTDRGRIWLKHEGHQLHRYGK
tara:strand:- start:319 stop:1014 length:696 start_codon:yes stop_codon:yes gene_type:complete